ncbi:ecto-NOX disulfide-thiol exchanger 2 [Hyalella azteca]|uniref:Ecto-NOX disulfide-thiol exchanger 2 n=1 Tax=Hyalella azteca TaxID=294128 RepID=A0A8B7NNH6_HYAAZ|nr:ecto-NOX disulfide-thiol exchanger 2 [Hyalella azteca]
MSNLYGYSNVMGAQQMSGVTQSAGMTTANSITMSAMMPPPPPPPVHGGMMQSQLSSGMQQHNMNQNTNMVSMGQQGMVNTMSTMTANSNGNDMMNNMMGNMMGSLQPPPPPPVNPATNDAPLDFNVNRNKAPAPIPLHSGNGMQDNMTSSDMNLVSSNGDGQEDSKDGVLSGTSRRDRDRDGSRGRDRDRDGRDRQRGGRGRDRDRDRDRSGGRSRVSRDRDSSPGRRDGRRRDSVNTRTDAAAMDQYAPGNAVMTGTGMDGQQQQQLQQQQYAQMAGNPWGMWNPMGQPMAGPMGPMGPMTQMAGMTGMTGTVGPMGPMAPMGQMAGPMLTGEVQPTGDFRITWGMFGWMMSPEGLTVPIKNQLVCKEVTLVPPNRLAPPPTTRERPLGCRTVFVGGLPENVTEEMVVDVFERCGEITTVRLSKKNFAHIRYELEEYVENAIFLSGLTKRYEWECRQRALQREQRHRERVEAERLRPPSPPPVPHYTEHEATIVAEHLKGEDGNVPGLDTFTKAATTLITWLERGDCSKRNTGTFYSMIQSTSSQVRRLSAEKMQYEEELAKFREQTRARMQGIVAQFSQIEKVFSACSQQKVWDHFTKAQRRNIDMWKKQAQEVKRIQLDDSDREDAEEMEVSDDEGSASSSSKGMKAMKKSTANDALKEENDSLRCQLEAYKNEVDMVKVDLKADLNAKEEQINTYKQTLQGMQQSLTDNVVRKRKDEARIQELQSKLVRLQETLRQLKKEKSSSDKEALDDKDEDKELIYEDGSDLKEDKEEDTDVIAVTSSIAAVDDKAAWLIGLTSTFLHIHPKGASVDYIWSYIQQFDKEIKPADVESMLNQFPTVYKQITTGVGACLERKWIFTGLRGDKTDQFAW